VTEPRTTAIGRAAHHEPITSHDLNSCSGTQPAQPGCVPLCRASAHRLGRRVLGGRDHAPPFVGPRGPPVIGQQLQLPHQ